MTEPELTPRADLAATEQLKVLQASMLSEYEQLTLRRRELQVQITRVSNRMRKIAADLGLGKGYQFQKIRTQRLEAIRRLMHVAKGPMTMASICREIEANDGKTCSQQKAWNILAGNPEDFVNVGFGLWDLRERHTPEEVAQLKHRRDSILSEIAAVGSAAKRRLK